MGRERFTEGVLKKYYDRFRSLMGKRSVLSLLDLPAITDKRQELAAASFSHVVAPTMMSDQPLMRFICLVAAIHALEHGLSPSHAYPFAMLGVILSSDFYDFDVGYQFGVLATRICDRFNNLSDKAKTVVTLGSLMHWTKPLLLSIPVLDEARSLGMQVGDVSFSAYAIMHKTVSSLYGGRPLRTLHSEIVQSRLFNSRHLNNQLTNEYLVGIDLVVTILTSNSQQISDLDLLTQSPSEVEFLQRASSTPSAMPLASYLVFKAQCLYIFGQPWMALQTLHQAAGKLVYITGHATTVYFLFLESLCMCSLLAKYPTTNAQQVLDDDRRERDDRKTEEERARHIREGKRPEPLQFGESSALPQSYSVDSRSAPRTTPASTAKYIDGRTLDIHPTTAPHRTCAPHRCCTRSPAVCRSMCGMCCAR